MPIQSDDFKKIAKLSDDTYRAIFLKSILSRPELSVDERCRLVDRVYEAVNYLIKIM